MAGEHCLRRQVRTRAEPMIVRCAGAPIVTDADDHVNAELRAQRRP